MTQVQIYQRLLLHEKYPYLVQK